MMRFWRVTAVVFVVLTTVFSPFLAFRSASAQPVPNQGLSLQISPLPIELTAKPGTSTSTDLRVRNAGVQTETLQVKLLKVTEDDNGIVHLTQPGAGDDWVKWISFSRTVFAAPSNQWQTINMKVDVPSTAAFGYYFAVEYLRATDQTPLPGQTVTRGAVATFVLLNADAPGAQRQAKIVSFNADRKSYEFLPANFTVKIRATGNVHVAPSGNIFILKGSKQVGVINVNAAGGNILPGSSRFFSSSWSDGFPVYTAKTLNGQPAVGKNGQVQRSLSWNFAHANRLRFGHYTAKLYMVYDNGSRDVPLQASVSFWVIPWRLVVYVILIIAAPAVLVYLIMRRRFKKRLEKERKKLSNAK